MTINLRPAELHQIGRFGLTGRTIVTGGAGFVGSHLCRRLLEAGSDVICIDNLSTGRLQNIGDLLGNPAFTLLQHDIIDPIEINGPVDRLFNLACAASPSLYQADPIHTMKTNVIGVMNLLELAKSKGARILQASTSEVYGDPEVNPQKETYLGNVNTFGPRACYDEGKRAAETLMHDYNYRHGVRIKVARIFNTYGPNMSPEDGRVIPNFVMQALRGVPITIFGDGSQTRSFCYVDDQVDGLLRLMTSPDHVTGPINIGNPQEFTIAEIAEKVISGTGSTSPIVYKALPVDDPKQRRPDITLAGELLGWAPRVAFQDGLQRTIDNFTREMNSEAVLLGTA